MRSPFDRSDYVLLAAFLLVAALATWNRCLLLSDGALLLSVGWLGDAWGLYFGQFADRTVALLVTFGPAWAARAAFGLSPAAYMTLAHALYFAVPLALWLVLRAVEPQRAFSRLYLAMALTLSYFPSELIVGAGLWTIWLALACDPARSARQVAVSTALLGLAMAFTHPAVALMSLLFLLVAGPLARFGRPVPRRVLTAALALSTLLLAAFVVTGRWLHPTNPTIVEALKSSRYYFVDPAWIASTMARFPVLAVLWLLLLAPGAEGARLRWRLAPWAVWAVAIFGLWFAVNGTGFLFYLYDRYSAGYVLAVALALAVGSVAWSAAARRPLMLYALVAAVTAVSYNLDVALFGRFVDGRLQPGIVDVDRLPPAWPQLTSASYLVLIPFKWLARDDYVRNLVVPDYGRYRWSLAFYSFFRSDRRAVLYHELPAGEWIPFECPAVARAHAGARDDLDRRFLSFLGERYCVK